MPEPIAIAHLTMKRGDCLCGAPDGPPALDVSVAVLSDGRWDDRSSVARCTRCAQIISRTQVAV
jgi:hypothetical protein